MKRAMLSLTVFGLMLFAGLDAQAQTNTQTNKKTQTATQQGKWKKSTTSSWQSRRNGTAYWYKRDKSGNLTSSTDNKKWDSASDNTWSDYDGKMYRIQGNNLEVSSNNGTTWSTSPNRYWRGSNGTWYGFDDSWTLWTGGSGNTAPDFSMVNSNTR